ncbi:MAG TPA: beta-N-acetylhexosaminidase [Abditibacteriaceae bacterium]
MPEAPTAEAPTSVSPGGDAYREADAIQKTAAGGVEQTVAAMTLEQRAGQMIMIGFNGLVLDKPTRHLIKKCHVGGVILFRNNVHNLKQVSVLTRQVQEVARGETGIPALVATDQEGGRIVRLGPSAGMPVFDSNRKLARAGDISAVQQAAAVTGENLRAVGINMNLAPVLDVVTTPRRRGVIGDRSFGSDPQLATQWGGEYIRELQKQNVIATAKHFPGHGATAVDSHLSLPVVSLGDKELQSTHIAPFRAAVENGVGAIMPAHIVYEALDKKNPATLSRRVLQQMLRDEMGFEGLVISDSMSMGAISKGRKWEDTVVASVRSGVDILLIPGTPQKQQRAFRTLVKAAKSDPVIATRVEESARRILQTKQRFAIWEANS